MPNVYIYSDEAGCLTFNRSHNVSKYFILCTITTSSLEMGHGLHKLRHELIHEGLDVGEYFHATTDTQAVRDRVYQEIMNHNFRIQATICEKAKAQPQVRSSRAEFYKYPWFYHVKHGIAPHLRDDLRLMVTAASIGTRREKRTYIGKLDDVMSQTIGRNNYKVDFRPCANDENLQVADYCAWAIQRKWERNDVRSYDIIKDRITREYDLWEHGTTMYY